MNRFVVVAEDSEDDDLAVVALEEIGMKWNDEIPHTVLLLLTLETQQRLDDDSCKRLIFRLIRFSRK